MDYTNDDNDVTVLPSVVHMKSDCSCLRTERRATFSPRHTQLIAKCV